MKSDIERGPFGTWAYRTRLALDPLTVEQVAAALAYSAPTLRKVEGGSSQPSRRMARDLPAYYLRVAQERGVTIPAPPGDAPDTAAPSDFAALLARLDEQARVIDRLAAAIEGLAQGQAELVGAYGTALAALRSERADDPASASHAGTPR